MPRPRRTTTTTDPGDGEITLSALSGMSAAELRTAIDQLEIDLAALHLGDDGELRELDDQEREAFEAKMHLRSRAEAHLRIREQYDRGGGVERAFQGLGGQDGTVPLAGRGDLLTRSQSVTDWLVAKRQIRAEQREVSFDRYLRALVAGAPYGADAEQRALSEGTLTAGGHLVPTPLAAQVIDLARNRMQVMAAGAVTVPMASNTLKVPRLTGEGTPGWHAENAAITAADMTFDAVTFDAQTLTRLVVLSVELFEDSDPSAENVIAQSFAAQIALEVDRAALRGSGTAPEPRGVLNTSGITTTSHGANGSVIGSPPAAGTMGWEFLVDSAAAVRNQNFEPNAQVMAPRTPQSLAKLRDTTNQYIAPPSYLEGIPRLQTKQVPVNLTVGTSTDCSEVYTAQWNQLMLGIRTTLRILPLRERFIDNGQYGFLAWLRADVQLAQPAAFVVDVGVRS
jgi:HK97 family phage major capsid protein